MIELSGIELDDITETRKIEFYSLFVNPDHIIMMTYILGDEDMRPRTTLSLVENGEVYVKETPEQILKLIKQAKK